MVLHTFGSVFAQQTGKTWPSMGQIWFGHAQYNSDSPLIPILLWTRLWRTDNFVVFAINEHEFGDQRVGSIMYDYVLGQEKCVGALNKPNGRKVRKPNPSQTYCK